MLNVIILYWIIRHLYLQIVTIIALLVLFITDYYVYYAIINHKTMYSVVYMFLKK